MINLVNLFVRGLFTVIPGPVFWPYFAGAVVSLAGLYSVRDEIRLAHGPEKIVALGPLFFAAPMAVFGAQHFTEAKSIMQMVPPWMPGAWFWTYFVGVCLLTASLSIVTRKEAWLSAPLLALMLFLFVAMLHIPRVVDKPSDRIGWAVALRDLAFSGGALAFAGTQIKGWRTTGTDALITIGRTVIAITALFFGVEQILHPGSVPGVPLERLTPAWIPGHIVWAYVGGVVSLFAGVLLIANRKTRLAATCLGVMVLVLVIFVYLPILGATPGDIGNGLNYFVDTLAFSGAALLLADAMPREAYEHA
jgi:uncharacterized membrane protein YphA (DoxX/SURF4 family)